MPKLRVLSGDAVIEILHRFGFVSILQKGSHAKLRRILPDGSKQPLTIPRHTELDPGTVKAIFRQASRYIPADTIKPYFYSE